MESLTCCIVSEGEDWICDTERSVDGVVENKSVGVDDCGAVGVSRLVAKDSSWALNLPLSPRGMSDRQMPLDFNMIVVLD